MPDYTSPEGLAKLKALPAAIEETKLLLAECLSDPTADGDDRDAARHQAAQVQHNLEAEAANALPALVAEIERLRKALAWIHQHGGALYRDTSSEWNYEPATPQPGPLPGVGTTPLDAIESSMMTPNPMNQGGRVMTRCAECAFTKGTVPNQTPWSMLKARLCLMAGEMFYCHMQGDPQPPCAGYVEALAKQPTYPTWKRKLAEAMGELLDLAESDPRVGEVIERDFPAIMRDIHDEINRTEAPEGM